MASSTRRILTRSVPVLLAASFAPIAWSRRKVDRLDSKLPTRPVEDSPLAQLGSESHRIWDTVSDTLPEKLLKFVDASPSPYHAVDNAKSLLISKGFCEVHEDKDWDLQPGGKYFVVRTNTSGSSLTAFAIGKQWQPGNPFSIVATHVDSPCLRLKPLSYRSGGGYEQVSVEPYGGGLWHTWFDRDLGIAGRVLVRTGPETIETRLVKIHEPLLHIPTLAVHYERQNPFEFDLENKLVPFLATSKRDNQEAQTRAENKPAGGDFGEHTFPGRSVDYWPSPAATRNPAGLVDRVAQELNVTPGMVVDFDLCLFDVQKSAIGGLYKEFIYASRLDNLMMTFCGLVAFTRSVDGSSALDGESAVRVLSLFDHEEISSKSSVGACSPFLPHILERICKSAPHTSKDVFERSMSRSFLLSADQTHAFHPLYPGRHDQNHRPLMNNGLVISSHPRNTFMRNTPGAVLLREVICRATDLTEDGEAPNLQSLTTPAGFSCGSTLGPLLGTQTGIRTLDVGNAQLSMHSTREMAGVADVTNAVAVLHGFWRDFVKIDKGIHLT